MNYCLDADICIEAVRRRHPGVARRIREMHPGQISISALARAEVLLGLHLGPSPHPEQQPLEAVLRQLRVLDFDTRASDYYVLIRADLHRRGLMIGANALVIAATALAHQAVLVTRNRREFSRVRGLLIEDWSQP